MYQKDSVFGSGRICIGRQLIFLLVIFTLMSLQNILGYFLQIRQYQRMIRKWLGKGILGVGQRRGLFKPGEILILVYNSKENAAITVQSMRGYSIFARFRERQDCMGLSLEELRLRGLEEDRRDLRLLRILFKYKPEKKSKRKGALIQAVEAVEKYMAKKSAEVEKPADAAKNLPELPELQERLPEPPAEKPADTTVAEAVIPPPEEENAG